MRLQHLVPKSALLALSLGALFVGALSYTNSANALTPVTATICQGGTHTPSITVSAPANNTTTGTSSVSLSLTAQWVRSVTVTGGASTVTAVLGNLATETAAVTVPLSPSTNYLSIVATGGCPESTDTQSLTITYNQNVATVVRAFTANRSPALRGAVNLPNARVFVVVGGHTYEATNNGDGTWTLPAGVITPDLMDGAYPVRVYTTAADGVTILSDNTIADALIIDTVPPTGSITTRSSTNRSPTLRGTVGSPYTTIFVNINGRTYQAINNGDGTWTLPANTIAQLASGDYPITITLTDRAGNITTLHSTLHIQASGEFGFILAPNTGYARVGQFNIPSLYLYVVALALATTLTWHVWRRRLAQAALPPRRRKKAAHKNTPRT